MALSQFSFTKQADPGMAKFARDRKLAEALAQQSLTVDPTQMAGGYAVRQTALNPLAKMAQALASRKIDERADTGERDYVRQRNEDVARAIAEARRAGEGREALPAIEAPPEELGGGPGRPELEARAPNPMRTYEALAGVDDPIVKQFGLQSMLSSIGPKAPIKLGKDDRLVDPTNYGTIVGAQQQPKITRVEIPDGKGGMRVGFVDMNNPNPMSTFQEGGAQPARMEMVNTGGTVTPVNPYQPPAGPLQKTPEIPPGFVRGPDGRLVADPGYIAGRSQIAAAGATRLNVNNLQEREEAKTVGGGFGKQYNEIQSGSMDAAGKISRLDRLEQLLDGVMTGKLTPAMTQVSAVADSLGIKIDPKLGAKQAVQALSNEYALQLRNPSGGAGMPGALSDKDREFLVSMAPGLATTPEGNKLIIDTARKLAKRDQDVARLAREYRQRKGQMDEGFYQELAQFSATNPLFGGGAIPGGQDRRTTPRQGSGRVVVDY